MMRELRYFRNHRPTEASEMAHSAEIAENPLFTGFWVDTVSTSDKLVKYGKNNKFLYSEQPTVIGQGSQREINIYCTVPAA